jgi:hypothetical protein
MEKKRREAVSQNAHNRENGHNFRIDQRGMDEPFDGLDGDKNGCATKQSRIEHSRDDFKAAKAERMKRRRFSFAQNMGEIGDQQSREIAQVMDRVRDKRHASGINTADDLRHGN